MAAAAQPDVRPRRDKRDLVRNRTRLRFLLHRPAECRIHGPRARRDHRVGRDHRPAVRQDRHVRPQSFAPLPTAGAPAGGPTAEPVLARVSAWYGNVVAVTDSTFALCAGAVGPIGT